MNEDLAERILNGLIEVKGELKAYGVQINALTQSVGKQNGRIATLEDWRQALALADAHDSGVIEGKARTLGGQKRAIIAAVSAIGVIAGAINVAFQLIIHYA